MFTSLNNLLLVLKNGVNEKLGPVESTKNLILALIHMCGTIEGRTKLQKIVFLSKYQENLFNDMPFKLHYYGPYSEMLSSILKQLESENEIDVNIVSKGFKFDNEEISTYTYNLTNEGKKKAIKTINELDNSRKEKVKKISKYNNLSLNELKDKAYQIWFSNEHE